MALVAAEHDPSSRRRVFAVYMQHGVVGALALMAVTILRYDEPARVLDALGSSGPMLVLLFFLFAATLSLLRTAGSHLRGTTFTVHLPREIAMKDGSHLKTVLNAPPPTR